MCRHHLPPGLRLGALHALVKRTVGGKKQCADQEQRQNRKAQTPFPAGGLTVSVVHILSLAYQPFETHYLRP
jgi:hypothetical protein